MKINYNNQEVDIFLNMSPIEDSTAVSLSYATRNNNEAGPKHEIIGSKIITPHNLTDKDIQLLDEIKSAIQKYTNG